MGPLASIKICFEKYATFNGRATRSEYWWFFLFIFVSTTALMFVDSFVFGLSLMDEAVSLWPISELFGLATLIPALAVSVRRMLDLGQNRVLWIVLLSIVTAGSYITTFLDQFNIAPGYDNTTVFFVIAVLLVLVMIVHLLLAIKPSQAGTNQHGPNPHEASS